MFEFYCTTLMGLYKIPIHNSRSKTVKDSNTVQTLVEFRVYWDAERDELATLNTTWLVDVFQQPLHSKHHYRQALNHILAFCPQLSEYLNKFQLALTGDFPTWKYNKKLIAEVHL